MIFRKFTIGLLLILLSVDFLHTAGVVDSHPVEENISAEFLFITGRLKISGNDPHVQYLVQDKEQDIEFVLDIGGNEHLSKYQNEIITVFGQVISLKLGPGFPAKFGLIAFQDKHGLWFTVDGDQIVLSVNDANEEELKSYLMNYCMSH